MRTTANIRARQLAWQIHILYRVIFQSSSGKKDLT